MDKTIHLTFFAADRSYFSILKKEIHNIAVKAGFNEHRTGEIDIVIAEISSNLVKHAGGGEILIKLGVDEQGEYLEIISIDNGPGMSEPLKMLEDGMSTTNTLGQGLGAIKRLSDTFEIYSIKDWGTILLSRIYKDRQPLLRKKPITEIRSIVLPKPGETGCGDAFYFNQTDKVLKLFLADGLGHGEEAQKAAHAAIDAIDECNGILPPDMLRYAHTQVRRTRGLVGTVALYYMKQKKWSVCGIGNIATKICLGTEVKNFMSYNGIIGLNIPNSLKEQELPGERGQIFIMCSDGIRTRWDLQKYPGVYKNDLSILAAAIYKDHARKTDDMSVVVTRINTPS